MSRPEAPSGTTEALGGHAGRLTFALAVALAALAGWVDATGFLAFKGLFVSFMSGNSTEGAIALGGDPALALAPFRTVLAFLVGVVAGEALGETAGHWARVCVLLLETALLTLAAVGWRLGWPHPAVATVLGIAMGVQNASVHKVGRVSLASTYVTGALVSAGRSLAKALIGRAPLGAALPYLSLWLGLVCGGLVGGVTAARSVGLAITVAAALSALLTGACGWLVLRTGGPPDQPGD